jgi:hypothetical protein
MEGEVMPRDWDAWGRVEENFTVPTTTRKRIYLIGSLRNKTIPEIAARLRDAGWDVFDDWYASGPEADDFWRDYEQSRGHDLATALEGHVAGHVYSFDIGHLDRSDIAVLVLPCGRSGHLELGYAVGKGKRAFVLMEGEPERFDFMYKMAEGVVYSLERLVERLK